jgi:4-diphosphocytidyl-2C-methyl-D-erythritol kinase
MLEIPDKHARRKKCAGRACHTDRQRSYPPLYTITQYKTIPILAGVGGGDSTFSIIKK